MESPVAKLITSSQSFTICLFPNPVDSNLTRNFGIKEPHFGGIQNNGEYCHSKDTEFYESLGDYTPFFEGLQEKDKSSKKKFDSVFFCLS